MKKKITPIQIIGIAFAGITVVTAIIAIGTEKSKRSKRHKEYGGIY